MLPLAQGRIVWVIVPDKNGHNAYERPVIILSRNEEIAPGGDLFGVVASHTAANEKPRPDSYIEIPNHPEGLVRTRLTKPTVAVCQWVIRFTEAEIAGDRGGFVSKVVLEMIINNRREIQSQLDSAKSAPQTRDQGKAE